MAKWPKWIMSSGYANATYTGAFGAMVNDLADTTSEGWVPLFERTRVVDFSVQKALIGQHYIMDVGRATRTDWKLFFRPFHSRVWVAGAVTILLISTTYQVFAACLGPFVGLPIANSQVLRILALSGWTLFTLAKSYWDAALTMFFTTTKELPFSTVEVRHTKKLKGQKNAQNT